MIAYSIDDSMRVPAIAILSLSIGSSCKHSVGAKYRAIDFIRLQRYLKAIEKK